TTRAAPRSGRSSRPRLEGPDRGGAEEAGEQARPPDGDDSTGGYCAEGQHNDYARHRYQLQSVRNASVRAATVAGRSAWGGWAAVRPRTARSPRGRASAIALA